MTFKLNQNSVSRRRYGSSTSFSVSSGPAVQGPWTNTGAGGALVFYASTDSYVTYANNGQFDLGTGDFTIEWWQYETDSNGAPRPWSFGQYPNAQLGISFEGSAVLWGGGGVLTTFNLSQPVQNTRNHFAWVRSQGFTTLWQNGQQLGGVEDTNNYNPTSDLTIGSEGAQDTISCFGGTITNFNMVNYAKYTAPFTPTNTALSIDTNARIFIPSTTQETWTEPYGDYTGTVIPSSNMSWAQVSPFKFPAPNPLVTFPYPAAQTGTTQQYQFPETHWTSYGQMASEGTAAGLVAYTYGGWWQGYTCASANFAGFSMQSNDGYNNDFYCAAGGDLITVPVYGCPDGGVYNPTTGMCEA